MPSAASVKLDKPQTNNSTANVAAKEPIAVENVDNSSPIRQVIVIIDHKIRNLEKRKVSHCPRKKKKKIHKKERVEKTKN